MVDNREPKIFTLDVYQPEYLSFISRSKSSGSYYSNSYKDEIHLTAYMRDRRAQGALVF